MCRYESRQLFYSGFRPEQGFAFHIYCESQMQVRRGKKKKGPFLPSVEAGFQEEPPLRAAHSIRLQQRSNRAGVSLSGSRAVPSCGAGNELFVVRHNASHTGFMSGLRARIRIWLPAVCWMNLLRVELEADDKQRVKNSQLCVGIKRMAVTEIG